ncbi:MAG TPA: histidine phosphatase family protein [Propionibacteriaceae bacterium]
MSENRVLYLMRHATADSWGILGDKNRPLTPAGREEAAFIGEQLADSGIEYVVVSAAARTRQTVANLGLGVDVESSDRLYGAGSATVLDIVHELDPGFTCVLVVGHAPSIPTLVHQLAGDDSDSEALDLVSTHFPTATCCRFEFEGPWEDLTTARLTRTIRTRLPKRP